MDLTNGINKEIKSLLEKDKPIGYMFVVILPSGRLKPITQKEYKKVNAPKMVLAIVAQEQYMPTVKEMEFIHFK